jgi:hypothetical protein
MAYLWSWVFDLKRVTAVLSCQTADLLKSPGLFSSGHFKSIIMPACVCLSFEDCKIAFDCGAVEFLQKYACRPILAPFMMSNRSGKKVLLHSGLVDCV